jgi:hypothetical protein
MRIESLSSGRFVISIRFRPAVKSQHESRITPPLSREALGKQDFSDARHFLYSARALAELESGLEAWSY